MRFAPAASALSLLAAVTASVSLRGRRQTRSARRSADRARPRALDCGRCAGRDRRFEAALAVDPAYTDIYLELAEAERERRAAGQGDPLLPRGAGARSGQLRRDFGRGRGAGRKGRGGQCQAQPREAGRPVRRILRRNPRTRRRHRPRPARADRRSGDARRRSGDAELSGAYFSSSRGAEGDAAIQLQARRIGAGPEAGLLRFACNDDC